MSVGASTENFSNKSFFFKTVSVRSSNLQSIFFIRLRIVCQPKVIKHQNHNCKSNLMYLKTLFEFALTQMTCVNTQFVMRLIPLSFSQLRTLLGDPVQVPRWDVPRWLPRSIIVLRVPRRSQIITSQPINKSSLPYYKEILSQRFLRKVVVLTEKGYF